MVTFLASQAIEATVAAAAMAKALTTSCTRLGLAELGCLAATGCVFDAAINKRSPCEAQVHTWSTAQTNRTIVKTVRATRLYIMKQTANSSTLFLGPGSKVVSIVFVLRKFPSKVKALQIALPTGTLPIAEGLFIKSSTGKRTLSVLFGHGNMNEATLVANVQAIMKAVREQLDVQNVRTIYVGVDRLLLPIWSDKLWVRGKQKRSERQSRMSSKTSSMPPPSYLPQKRLRTA